VTIRDLEYIVAVADLAHFGKAATRCHVGQPTLSGQIRKLEEYLGVTIFERTKRSVRLTPVGEQIVGIARELLERAERIERMAREHHDPSSGRFRLGMIPTIAPYLIPRFVSPLGKRLPRLDLILVEEITEGLIRRLTNGELEAAVVATDPDSPRVSALPLYREPFWLALPVGHRLENSNRIRPSDFLPGELLLLADGHCVRDQALEICGEEATVAGADTTATSLETILNLVSAGHGLTLVPALALRESSLEHLRITTRPLTIPGAERTVRMIYRSGYPHKPLLEEIASVIRAALPETVTPLEDATDTARAGG